MMNENERNQELLKCLKIFMRSQATLCSRRKHCLRAANGFTLVEMILVIAVFGILLVFSVASWSGLFERVQLKYEISRLSTTIGRAYKDAISNGIYVTMELHHTSNNSIERDYYLVYWEKNGILGYQENEDEKINLYYLPTGIKFGSIEGLLDNYLVLSPSGLIKIETNSTTLPAYAYAQLCSANLATTLRISVIGEIKEVRSE